MPDISKEQQLAIIADTEKKFGSFYKEGFNRESFFERKDNFALNEHNPSVCIINKKFAIKPHFSIAIPTYKRVDELERALQSALNQDIDEEYEILVVENTDNFEETQAQALLKRFEGKINYYKNSSNLGCFGNWNRCLSLAQGQWICLLHSDDEIMPNYLSEMKKILDSKKFQEAILIGCIVDLKEIFPPIKSSKIIYKMKFLFQKLFLSKDYINKKSTEPQKWKRESLSDETVFLPPNALLHNKNRCLKLGGYNVCNPVPSEDQIFVNKAHKNGNVFLYRRSIIQKKYSDVSSGLQPKTLFEMAFTEPIIFSALIKSKKLASRAAFTQIRSIRKELEKNRAFILSAYLLDFCSKHKIRKNFLFINKIIAFFKEFLQKIKDKNVSYRL